MNKRTKAIITFIISFIIALLIVTIVGYVNHIFVAIDWVENVTLMQKISGYFISCSPIIIILAFIIALITTGIISLINRIRS
jgi:hypothetical protein